MFFVVYILVDKFYFLPLNRHLISSLQIKNHETVLDVGCGRGLLLIEAAKHVKSGKAIGIDLWNKRELSGNTKEAVLANLHSDLLLNTLQY